MRSTQRQQTSETLSPFPSEASLLNHLAILSTMTFRDESAAIQMYLCSCMELLGVRSVFISQFLPGSQLITHVANQGGCALSAGDTTELHESFCQYVLASNAPVVIPNTAIDPRVRELPTRTAAGVGSYLGVPLLLQDGLMYGTLCALDPDPREFLPEHVAFLRIIARYIVAIIEPTLQRTTTIELQAPTRSFDDEINDALDAQIRLVQIVAHDVRSPLMTISGYTELLKEEETTPDQREMLELIERSSQFINRLMNDLMNVSALRQHSLSFITEEFDVIVLVRQLISAFHPEAEANGVELSSISDQSPLCIIGDRDRVQQVLLNLLGNALRYTKQGWVRLSVASTPDEVIFHVEDSGPGIAPDIQAKIWECYTRGTSTGKGFGIGLYAVRLLVEAMGGSVSLTSEVGRGSHFVVRLPREGPRPQQVVWT